MEIVASLMRDNARMIEYVSKKASAILAAALQINQIEAALQRVEKIPDGHDFSEYGGLRLSYYSANTIKEFSPVFEELENVGIPLESWVCTMDGSARVYDGRIGADGLHVSIRISAQSCKLVQIGTKMVEQPIYEVQCEEDEPASAGEANAQEAAAYPAHPDRATDGARWGAEDIQ